MWRVRQNDGCSETAIKAFLYNFEKLTSGANLMIPESALSPVESLPSYDALTAENPELLKDTVRHRSTAAPQHRHTAALQHRSTSAPLQQPFAAGLLRRPAASLSRLQRQRRHRLTPYAA